MEEQASAVEAVRAENAAALAKLAENEARARALQDAIRDLRAAHDAQVSMRAMRVQFPHQQLTLIFITGFGRFLNARRQLQ